MSKPVFALPLTAPGQTTKQVLDAEANRVITDLYPLNEAGAAALADQINADAERSGVNATRSETARDDAQGVLPDRLRRDVPTLLADTTLTYTAGQTGTVAPDDIIRTRAEGFSYKVAPADAAPRLEDPINGYDITTAGGVKLYVLPLQIGGIPARAVSDDIQGALNAASDIVYIPDGDFSAVSLRIEKSLTIIGSGRAKSIIRLSGHTTYDGVKAAVVSSGDDSQGLGSTVQIRGVRFLPESADPEVNGILVTRKQYWQDVEVRGAPANGILMRSLNVNTQGPYFGKFESVWSKQNGQSGLRITDNCNANLFLNCQFDSNGDHGVIQTLIGLPGINQAVYSNVFIGGQASFNQKHGIFFQNGSNCQILGTYAEYNSASDGGDPRTGAFKNLQLGPTVSRMNISLGEQGTDTNLAALVGLNTVASNYVAIGGSVLTPVSGLTLGYSNVGSGRDLVFNGAGGAVHNIKFREGLNPIFDIRYDGVPTGAQNEMQFVPFNNGVEGTPAIRMRNNGQLGFFGVTPVSRQTVAAAATDPATTQALVNDLRDKLIALGLLV